MLRADLCDFSDAYIVVKRDISDTKPNDSRRNKSVVFKNNAPFITVFQKSMVNKLTMQRIWMLLCQCTIF